MEYFEDVLKLINSPSIGQSLANWGKCEDPVTLTGPTA